MAEARNKEIEMDQIEVRGNLPDIILNKDNIYQGNLAYYFRWIFFNAENLGNPYHNFRHLFRTVWMCYKACVYYGDGLTSRDKRNLLIAAGFHDLNHTGGLVNDGVNIERAILALEKSIAPEDAAYFNDICSIIRATEFPHKIESEFLSLPEKILRDADVAQALDPAWVQEVVFGLAEEWGMEPIKVLKNQITFLSNLKFGSEWARQTYPQGAITDKITEVLGFLEILIEKDSSNEGDAA